MVYILFHIRGAFLKNNEGKQPGIYDDGFLDCLKIILSSLEGYISHLLGLVLIASARAGHDPLPPPPRLVHPVILSNE